MSGRIWTVIEGSGSYITERRIPNDHFLDSEFYNPEGKRLEKSNPEIIAKFEEITRIKERRYAKKGEITSDIATRAAENCLGSSQEEREELDYVVVAHNFGDVPSLGAKYDLVPSIASRVKHELGIENSATIAYDVITPREYASRLATNLTAVNPEGALILRVRVRDEKENISAVYGLAREILETRGCDRESLEQIVVFHEDIPCVASKVKQNLHISDPDILPYDILFGCPGWLQGVIQIDEFFKQGFGKDALVIGAEILSRVSDPHDIDSMLYADGAGATRLRAVCSGEPVGFLSHASRSDTKDFAYLLRMARSNNRDWVGDNLFLKMEGHRLYEYALGNVAQVVKESLDKAGLSYEDVKKILIHQANEKLDEGVVKRFFKLYGIKASDDQIREVMPMIISWLGNSSVATIAILYDLIIRGKVNNHHLEKGNIINFSSVGAGMNRNSATYKMSGLERMRMAA